jgi:glutaminyl-peptide cyclotransferase
LKNLLTISFAILLLAGCKNSTKPEQNQSPLPDKTDLLKFTTSLTEKTFKNNESIPIEFTLPDTMRTDSVQIRMDGLRIAKLESGNRKFVWVNTPGVVGHKNVEVEAYYKGESLAYQSVQLRIVSGTPAKTFGYKVLAKYAHDGTSYTQGLQFDGSNLYESSGLYGNSTLRKVDLKSGKILQSINLTSDIFGEGITIFDDKIIQLSWQEHVAFLYDKHTFKLLRKFEYPTEGWGIAYNGKDLIMSDGSSNLYYMDKNSFSLKKQVQVCDQHGPVEKLNELEWIEGEIWANVYMTDTIVKINPETGVVTEKIDMSGLLKPEERLPETNVLNGIAYSPDKKLYVTGKKWPFLYRITLVEKGK